jgi:hypothetical protein
MVFTRCGVCDPPPAGRTGSRLWTASRCSTRARPALPHQRAAHQLAFDPPLAFGSPLTFGSPLAFDPPMAFERTGAGASIQLSSAQYASSCRATAPCSSNMHWSAGQHAPPRAARRGPRRPAGKLSAHLSCDSLPFVWQFTLLLTVYPYVDSLPLMAQGEGFGIQPRRTRPTDAETGLNYVRVLTRYRHAPAHPAPRSDRNCALWRGAQRARRGSRLRPRLSLRAGH